MSSGILQRKQLVVRPSQRLQLRQGTRDALADTHTLRALVERLGKQATLKLFQDADHSFHVPARTGRDDAEVRAEMLDTLASWLRFPKVGWGGTCRDLTGVGESAAVSTANTAQPDTDTSGEELVKARMRLRACGSPGSAIEPKRTKRCLSL